LAEIKKHMDGFDRLNITVVAISSDSVKQSEAISREMALPFQLLCDADKRVINQYNVLNTFEHGGIAKPSIFLVAPSGKIRFRSFDGTARRANIKHLLSVIENLDTNKKSDVRPSAKKKWIIPPPKATWQLCRNLVLRGNVADWKHTFLFPLEYAQMLGSKLSRSIKKKSE
jgi:alkyl hydroperoxide reductase subunit AhpC